MDPVKVQNTIKVQTGHYTGTIVKAQKKEITAKDGSKADYKEYVVEVDVPNTNPKPQLNLAFPFYVSQGSGLGKFLIKLGISIIPDQIVDVDSVVGMRFEFDVVNTASAKGVFSTIFAESISPLRQQIQQFPVNTQMQQNIQAQVPQNNISTYADRLA